MAKVTSDFLIILEFPLEGGSFKQALKKLSNIIVIYRSTKVHTANKTFNLAHKNTT